MLCATRPTEDVVVLREITPGKPRIPPDRSLPLLASELLNASGVDLKRGVQAIVSALGFASFMYGMSTSPQPNRESRSYVWTTLPREWVAIYDENAYIEIDPRLTHCWQHVTPFVWDRHCSSTDASVTAFLDHAAEYGVGSGVVVPCATRFTRSCWSHSIRHNGKSTPPDGRKSMQGWEISCFSRHTSMNSSWPILLTPTRRRCSKGRD